MTEFQGHHTNRAYTDNSSVIERGLHFYDDCVISCPCLKRLVSSKNKYKQVPVNNDCVTCQSYHRNCIYESGLGIILNP